MSTTVPFVPYAEAQRLRRYLIEKMGVPAWMCLYTSNNDMPELKRRFEEIDRAKAAEAEATEALVEPEYGVLQRLPSVRAMFDDDCTPDEVASVLTYVKGRLVEPSEVGGFNGDAA